MIDVPQLPRVYSREGITAEMWNRLCDLVERACRIRPAEGIVMVEDARGTQIGLDLGRFGGSLTVQEADGSPSVGNVTLIQFDQNEFGVTEVGTGIARVDGIVQVIARRNSTGSEFTRRRLNFIEGTNVTLTLADDSVNNEIDLTIAASNVVPDLLGAKVRHNAAQTITAGAETTLAFNTEVYDEGGFHDNATNNSRLTAPEAGYYEVGALIWWATPNPAPTATTGTLLLLRKNGTTVVSGTRMEQQGAVEVTQQLIWQGSLAQNDYLEVRVNQGTDGGGLDVKSFFEGALGESPVFWMHRLGL